MSTTYGTIPTSEGGTGSKVEFLSRATERIQTGLGTSRSWREMFNIHKINFPHGFSDTYSRIKTNLAYFRMNYAIIMLVVLFLSLLWYPISLIVFVVLMAGWLLLYFLRDEPLVIFHYTIDDRVVLAVLAVVTIGLLLLTGATINILVSILIGLAVVVVHAFFRKTEDLCLDEEGVGAGP